MDDDLIAQQLNLFRFTASERARVLRILRQMEEELIELLFYSGKPLSGISRADKARLLAQAQNVIARYYGQASDSVADNLGELGQVEAGATRGALETAFRSAIVPALPTETFFRKLVTNTLINGAPSAAWWARQAGDVGFRFDAAVSQGLAAAETNAQIITRVRGRSIGWKLIDGKRVHTYAGGVMQASRANAAALVQTSVQTVANAARMATFEANDDVIKGFRQLSTLDSHTSVTCTAYSGATWDFQKKPTGQNTLPFINDGGSLYGTPRHWNCRSLITPITKTFKELGLDIPEFKDSTRSSLDGQVAASTTFDAFLKRKGAKFSDEQLGAGRAELWRAGKLTLPQLLDATGRPLTLAQLRRRYG